MSKRPGGYQRSTSGLIGAMIILLVVIFGFVALRGLSRNDLEVPAREVPSQQLAQVTAAARDEGGLAAPVPTPLPDGWKVTSVTYRPGPDPTWHLGTLTDQGRYLGIEEKDASARSLAEEFVDAEAVEGEAVEIGGRSWSTWTDEDGDYAVATEVGERTVLVGGSAPDDVVRDIAAGLDLG